MRGQLFGWSTLCRDSAGFEVEISPRPNVLFDVHRLGGTSFRQVQ
nr:hypothetical protein JVH1_0753 [Rhodococcus sp. JVH1]